MKNNNNRAICSLFILVITLFCLGGCGKSRKIAIAHADYPPVWLSAPSDITLKVNGQYSRINGIAVDLSSSPQHLACIGLNNTCSFPVNVLGIDDGSVNCMMQFTTGNTLEVCSVDVVIVNEFGTIISQTININAQGVLAISCTPNPVDEYNAVSCTVNETGGTAQIDAAHDTCGGALAGGVYSFSTDENDGGTTCVAAVELAEDPNIKDSESIAINEVNEAPMITSSAPTTATEDVLYTYNATATDADLPPNVLTWSLSVGDTCGGAINPASGVYTFTPPGPIPPASCNLNIKVCDNGVPVLCDAELVTINITAVNDPPSFSSTPPNATENTAYSYSITCTDPEGDTLTLSLSAGNTCGGTVTDSGNGTGMYSGWTPSELQGGSTCVVGITCSDGQIPVNQNTTINIIEDNPAPTWNPAPSEIWVFANEVHSANNGHALDSDVPQNTLTCSKASQTCSFGITVSGSGSGAVDCSINFTAGASAETCDVNVQVLDGNGGVISQNVIVHVDGGPCILRVDAAATGTGTGFSWANAFPVIQNAVNRAYSGCQVWVKTGTYLTGNLNPVLTMKDGVAIYGGFVGTENVLADRPAPGVLTHSVIDAENMNKHAVIGASDALLDGVKVQGAYRMDMMNYPRIKGGGMYNKNISNLTVSNSVFDSNFTYQGGGGSSGGGMFNSNASNLYIGNCVFSNNTSDNGAGIENRSSDVTVNNSKFTNNFSKWNAGAIASSYSTTGVYNSVFDSNSAYRFSGGAIESGFADNLHVDNCEFKNNFGSVHGGAITNSFNNFTISNSYFSGNEGSYFRWYGTETYRGYGGAIYNQGSSGEISDCILKDNYSYKGGGIWSRATTLLLSNNLIVDNRANFGGGMYLKYNNYTTIKNTTIANNQAGLVLPGLAGGILCLASPMFMENSIVWGNYDEENPNWLIGFRPGVPEDIPRIIYSDVGLGASTVRGGGAGLINVDPKFIGPDFFDSSTTVGTTNSFQVANASIYQVGDYLRIEYFRYPFQVTAASGTTVTINQSFSAPLPKGLRVENWGSSTTFVYDYHLSQTLSGQSVTSSCVNAGNPVTPVFGTTRTNGTADTGIIDMGFHYPIP